MIYLYGIIPLFFSILALKKKKYLYKALVTASIILFSLIYMIVYQIDLSFSVILGALLFSIIGDYFLNNNEKHPMFYVLGIAVYFMAHACYLVYMLMNGVLNISLLIIFFVCFSLYFIFRLYPSIKEKSLLVAVLLYLGISCLTFAATFGLSVTFPSKALMVSAVGLIVFSDIMIAETDFVKNRRTAGLILPTYYLAHICLLYSIFFI
ncbi:MAG: hypothetical protein JXQ23_09835 [Clostridia bacterium]|nr:hypothetical protein [Clostridia bacterium]